MKRLLALLVCFCMTIVCFSGCSLLSKNEDRYANEVVAKVGDEEITREDVASLFYTYYTSYGYSYYYSQDEVVDLVLESLINQKLVLIEAKKVVKLNNSDKNDIWQDVFDSINTELDTREKKIYEELNMKLPERLEEEEKTATGYEPYESPVVTPITFNLTDTTSTISDKFPEITDVYRLRAFNEYVAELVQTAKTRNKPTDKTIVFEAKLDELYDAFEDQFYYDKYKEYIESRVVISDDEAVEKYKTLLNIEKQTYLTTSYKTTIESSTNKNVLLYNDYEGEENGYIRVQHLLISFTDEDKAMLAQQVGYGLARQQYQYYIGEWTPSTSDEENTAVKYDNQRSAWETFIALRSGMKNNILNTYLDAETGEKVKEGDEDKVINYTDLIALIDTALAGCSNDVERAIKFREFIYCYGSDPGILSTESVVGQLGYLIPKDESASSSFYGEFVNASQLRYNHAEASEYAAGLVEHHDYYDIAITDYGMHLIMVVGDTTAGAVCEANIDDMKATYLSTATGETVFNYVYGKIKTEKLANLFTNKIAELSSAAKSEKNTIKIYKDTYKEIFG